MRSMELAEFNREIQRAVKTIPAESIVKFHKKISLEFLARVIDKTPVDTGRARGNWQTTINERAHGALATTDRAGTTTFASGAAALSSLRPYVVVWVANNVEYISFLEDGTSRQAPHGMVKVALNEMELKYT